MNRIRKVDRGIWIILFYGIIYLLFPSANNSNDAYMYAGDIQQRVDLFYPHHLLFNAFSYGITQLFSIHDTLSALCFINALFAMGCLFLLRGILLLALDRRTVDWILVGIGSCWGVMRYATEGETYILPLFFSLAASYAAFRKHSVFGSSMFAAIACLFHQIHVFWWLGLAFFFIRSAEKGEYRSIVLRYLAGAWVVPFAYFWVFYGTSTGCDYLYQYVFHDYLFVESVGFSLKHALLLTPINFIRTFMQVHGYILPLLKTFPFVLIGILLSCIFFWKGCRRKERFAIRRKEANPDKASFAYAHLWIALMQLGFAFLSNGNAEFMVMLPFACAIGFFLLFEVSVYRLACFSLMLCAWNLSIGLLPYHFIELYPYKALEKYIVTHPDETFVVEAYPQLFNQLRYHSPGAENRLEKEMIPGKEYMTDRYYNRSAYSRAAFVKGESSDSLEKEDVMVVDTLHYDLGEWIISQKKLPILDKKVRHKRSEK